MVRLKDVGRAELAGLDYSSNSYLNLDPAVAIAVFQRPGSNALATAQDIRKTMADASKRFPQGLKYEIVYDPTQFIQQSVDAVMETILEAILLVVLVVVLFLQTWRAAIIPLVAIPVSLIGTFFLMATFGFSLNNLSLFGLVLAVGIVVDDAIVVVENVERNIANGLEPARCRAAKHGRGRRGAGRDRARAVRGVHPVGVHHRHFRPVLQAVRADHRRRDGDLADRLADAVAGALRAAAQAASTSARRSAGGSGRCAASSAYFNRGFDKLAQGYGWLASRVVRFTVIMLLVYAGIIAFGLNEFRKTPIGFIPALDRGYLIVVAQLPPGSSLSRTDAVQRRIVDTALKVPGVIGAVNIVGFSGATFTNAPNAGAAFLVLDSFEKRAKDPNQSAAGIQRALFGKLAAIQEAMVFVVAPPPVHGHRQRRRLPHDDRGSRRPRSAGVAGRGLRHDGQGRADAGAGAGVLAVRELDAAALSRHRPPEGAAPRHQRVRRVLGAADLSRLVLRQRLQPVRPHLPRHRAGQCRSAHDHQGRARHPRAQLQRRHRAARLVHDRARHLRARTAGRATISIRRPSSMAPRRPATARARRWQIMEKLAAETLPDGFGYEWTTLAFQQLRAGNTAIFAFVLAVVFVFLVLAAQFESLTLPVAVILIVPMCLIASIVGVVLRGQDNNILTQVGFIVLIGLAAKNAILIVEFAKQLEDQGRDRIAAAVEAARLRLRPILMTSLAFIFGVSPMVWAVGAGAELRQTLGTTVFSGMIGVTIFGLIFTPVFYVVSRWVAERPAAVAMTRAAHPAE